jgi:uncharacterized protein (TIGR03435 family)
MTRKMKQAVCTFAKGSAMLSAAFVGAVLSSAFALAQSAPAPATAATAFDVISIHPSRAQDTVKDGVEFSFMKTNNTDDGYTAENVTLKALISDAYQIKPDDISGGPDWIGSDRYNINAKVAGSDGTTAVKLTKAQHRQMLQALLANRFSLAVHNETKDAPIYELVVAKGGSKLHAFTPVSGAPRGVTGLDGKFYSGIDSLGGNGIIALQGYPVSLLADFLKPDLQRPVIDKTGLTGKYDISLRWTPDNTPADSPLAGGPSIFAAIEEQLGLKLNSTKGPVTTLVIDHVQKPSEN